ncbi:hypothetical protein [Shewanella algae]|uniref:hypothetical protein n=1 Tax=Shewanella algae TaxID=38313 RepID=UPI001AAE5471|nr:hypothetical protein [Shewanella algae]MBO2582535.1 hypothetical protein [Shewanella algae]
MYPRLQLSQSISTNSALITFFLIKPPETKPYMEGTMRLDKRETDRGLWALSCIIASIVLGLLILGASYVLPLFQ